MEVHRIQVTRNFACNLEEIEQHFRGCDSPRGWETVLERLFEEIIPTLRQFPLIGRDFLDRQPLTYEGVLLVEQVKRRLGNQVSLREYLSGDYHLLYAIRGEDIFILAVKHYPQASFDLSGDW